MKISRWNAGVIDFLSIEIVFDDTSRKTWDYDALYFNTLDDLKANMAADFTEPLENCSEATLYLTIGQVHYTGTVELPDATGLDFSEYVFNHLADIEGVVS